ncbi:MAG TPA: DUF3040 domain-containing protein, partial [Micromonosporaceae bacterium]
MPLSEHEQRLFDQIEQSLAKDPKFASAVRATDPRFHTRRRIVLAAILGVVGFGLVIAGPITMTALISVIGFVIMLAALIFGTSARKGRTLRSVGGTATRSTRPRKLSAIDRLEERWRNRPEGNR